MLVSWGLAFSAATVLLGFFLAGAHCKLFSLSFQVTNHVYLLKFVDEASPFSRIPGCILYGSNAFFGYACIVLAGFECGLFDNM
jgi:hypothetical protein